MLDMVNLTRGNLKKLYFKKASYVLEAINNERRLEELLIYTAVSNSLK